MTSPSARRVLAVIPDLFFATKVAATAKALGVELELVPPPRATVRASEAPPSLLLLDLHAPDAVALVAALKAAFPTLPVVGFYSHVETALRASALAAGADAALPRSQFVGKLAALLQHGVAALRGSSPMSEAKTVPLGEAKTVPLSEAKTVPLGEAKGLPMLRGRLIDDEATLTAIARELKTVAVVGIKDANEPDAPAFDVPQLLAESGVRILGVNPKIHSALGQSTLASVAELREPPDLLDVFRRSDAIPQLADELLALPIAVRPRVIWLQSGIRHDAAAARLVAGGYDVVQDRCLGVYRRRAQFGR